MMVMGTLYYPAVHGYPSVTFILDDGEPFATNYSAISKYINVNGVTSGVLLYTSGPKTAESHTLKWTVNKVSPLGPRFYIDAFWVFKETVSSTDSFHYAAYDTRIGFQYGPNTRNTGIMGGYIGSDASEKPSMQSFSYKFEGMYLSHHF